MLAHAFRAVWKAGALSTSWEPRGKPPLGSGSGKSVTPCARMHCVNLMPALALSDLVVPPVPADDPHAASAGAHAATTDPARIAATRGRNARTLSAPGWKREGR
jgi:hypothetical protein